MVVIIRDFHPFYISLFIKKVSYENILLHPFLIVRKRLFWNLAFCNIVLWKHNSCLPYRNTYTYREKAGKCNFRCLFFISATVWSDWDLFSWEALVNSELRSDFNRLNGILKYFFLPKHLVSQPSNQQCWKGQIVPSNLICSSSLWWRLHEPFNREYRTWIYTQLTSVGL